MTTVLCLSLFAAVMAALLFRQLWRVQSLDDQPEPEVRGFSFWDYRSMARLLSRDECRSTAPLSRVQAREARRLRQERRRVFRVYLGHLRRDFRALERAANRILLTSREDRPDLAQALAEQRWRFYGANLRLEVALLLHAAGVDSVEVRPLLAACRQLQAALVEAAHADGRSAA